MDNYCHLKFKENCRLEFCLLPPYRNRESLQNHFPGYRLPKMVRQFWFLSCQNRRPPSQWVHWPFGQYDKTRFAIGLLFYGYLRVPEPIGILFVLWRFERYCPPYWSFWNDLRVLLPSNEKTIQTEAWKDSFFQCSWFLPWWLFESTGLEKNLTNGYVEPDIIVWASSF